MSAGWVAAAARGQGLARRRLGHEGVRSLAASPSLSTALATLSPTAYGRELRTDMDLPSAQHAVSAALVWHLRILAGWCPPLGAGPLHLLAAGFEIANVTGHLARLRGESVPPPYALGSLVTSWPAISKARTPAGVRGALSASVWGDPGSDDPAAIRLALQLAWARRVLDGTPEAADWAISRAAFVLARVVGAGAVSAMSPSATRDANHVLGTRWREAMSISDLIELVPHVASLALRGVEDVDDLWRAEVRRWAVVETSGGVLVARGRLDASSTIGVVGLLAADAWWTRAALTIAAHGGRGLAEVLDAVA